MHYCHCCYYYYLHSNYHYCCFNCSNYYCFNCNYYYYKYCHDVSLCKQVPIKTINCIQRKKKKRYVPET